MRFVEDCFKAALPHMNQYASLASVKSAFLENSAVWFQGIAANTPPETVLPYGTTRSTEPLCTVWREVAPESVFTTQRYAQALSQGKPLILTNAVPKIIYSYVEKETHSSVKRDFSTI